jgi:hypothetical protein
MPSVLRQPAFTSSNAGVSAKAAKAVNIVKQKDVNIENPILTMVKPD